METVDNAATTTPCPPSFSPTATVDLHRRDCLPPCSRGSRIVSPQLRRPTVPQAVVRLRQLERAQWEATWDSNALLLWPTFKGRLWRCPNGTSGLAAFHPEPLLPRGPTRGRPSDPVPAACPLQRDLKPRKLLPEFLAVLTRLQKGVLFCSAPLRRAIIQDADRHSHHQPSGIGHRASGPVQSRNTPLSSAPVPVSLTAMWCSLSLLLQMIQLPG
jgi:hypothetical protein